MKQLATKLAVLMYLLFLLAACSTTGITTKQTNAWVSSAEFKNMKTIALGAINVDKPGGGWSVEQEISTLLPLLFMERGWTLTHDKAQASYIADIYATEREYYAGWHSKKSLALELVFYPASQAGTAGNTGNVFAAGRTIAQGSVGFTASKNIEALLRISLKKIEDAIQKVR